MHFCYLEIICRFSFWTLKTTFYEYMKGYRQLFYTINDILQQTFAEQQMRNNDIPQYKKINNLKFLLLVIF